MHKSVKDKAFFHRFMLNLFKTPKVYLILKVSSKYLCL